MTTCLLDQLDTSLAIPHFFSKFLEPSIKRFPDDFLKVILNQQQMFNLSSFGLNNMTEKEFFHAAGSIFQTRSQDFQFQKMMGFPVPWVSICCWFKIIFKKSSRNPTQRSFIP